MTSIAPNNPNDPNALPASPAPGATPPNGANPPTPPPPPAEFRYGPDAPAWAQNRTANEVLGLAQNMAEALRVGQPAPQPQSQVQTPPNGGMPTDATWMTNPNGAAQDVFKAAFGPQIQQYVNQQAGMIRGIAEHKYADEFRRWGPEIDTVLSRVSPDQRTLDIVDHAVKLVRGNHIDEIADERVKAKMAQMGGMTERADGSGAGGPGVTSSSVDLTKLPNGLAAMAAREGLTVQMVQDSCKAMGMSTDQWMKLAQEQKTFSSTGKFGFEMNEHAEGMGGQRQFS